MTASEPPRRGRKRIPTGANVLRCEGCGRSFACFDLGRPWICQRCRQRLYNQAAMNLYQPNTQVRRLR